jgi:GNAT superfamily N-acetyltransferase
MVEKTKILPNIFVRCATRQDVPELVRLLADDMLGSKREKVHDPLPQAYYEAFEQIDSNSQVELIVVEQDGAVIGTLQLTFMVGLSFQGGKRAQVEAVRVASHLRGQGIGRALFRWVIEYARAQKCYVIQLTTNNQRIEAHRFYHDLGFVSSHVGMKLYLDGGQH